MKITKVKTLKNLNTNIIQNRDKGDSHLRSIYGIDTETYKGNIFLIADSDGDFIDTFTKDGITIDTVIKFLTRQKFETTWNFFYNLDYDATVILKLLGKEILSTYTSRKGFRFKYNQYSFYYIPKKTLRISKGKHSWAFFDIAQFYNFMPLQKAYETNIKKLPESYLKMKGKRAEFTPRFYKRCRKQVRQYCIDDCIFTKELSENWIKLCGDAFGFYCKRYLSSGYLAEKVLINYGVQVPYFKDLPYDLQEFAYNSYFGGRFEMIQRGFIGEAYLYDINSAYPYALTKVPDITKGSWRFGIRQIHENAILGFFKIHVKYDTCEYLPALPFMRKTLAGESLIFPSGEFVTFATLEELKQVDPKNYKILESWQYFDDNPTYPFKEFVETFYRKRQELKSQNNPQEKAVKIVLNALYGKMGGRKPKMSNLFNPVIFAFITGHTRAQLFKFVKDNNLEKDVVAFATDSVCCTKKLDIDSKELGSLSFDKYGKDVLYVQNGFYRFDSKWAQRGLGNLKNKEIEHVETIERDGRLYFKYVVKRTRKLASSIRQNKITEIGIITPFEKEINLNSDEKRFWGDDLKSINEKKRLGSVSINPEFYPQLFELNADYNLD